MSGEFIGRETMLHPSDNWTSDRGRPPVLPPGGDNPDRPGTLNEGAENAGRSPHPSSSSDYCFGAADLACGSLPTLLQAPCRNTMQAGCFVAGVVVLGIVLAALLATLALR